MISQKDAKLIRHYKTAYKWEIAMLLFLIALFVWSHCYLVFDFIPNYLKTFQGHPKLQQSIFQGITVIGRLLYIWPILAIGRMAGEIISNKRLCNLLERLTGELPNE